MAELKLEEYSNKGQASGTDLSVATSNISPSTDNNLDGSCGNDSEEKSCDIVSMPTRCKLSAHFQKHRHLLLLFAVVSNGFINLSVIDRTFQLK